MSQKEDWIEKIITDISNEKRYKSPLNKCLGNMPQKKFYKYYSFDSQYTLDNIRNDIIYLSNPVEFNDPLDCNIGISANSLMRSLFPTLLEKSGVQLSDEAYQLLNTLLFNDVPFDPTADGKEAIIAELLADPQTAALFSPQQNGKAVDEAQLLATFADRSELLAKLVRLTYGGQLSSLDDLDKGKIISYVSQSPRALKNMLSFLPGIKPDETHILDVFSRDEDMIQKVMDLADCLGQPIDKNTVENFYLALEDGIKTIHKSIGGAFGVSCFTETPDNMLMWAHYANKHTGICVEYDFGKLFSDNQDSLLFPVSYTDKRPLLPLEKIASYENDDFTFDKSKNAVLAPDMMKALITKSAIWSYEQEWRLIRSTKTDEDRIIKLPLISGIYTGINITGANLQAISAIAREKGVPLFQCALKNDRYEMIIK